MDFLPEAITLYAEKHTAPESPILQKINRETHLQVLKPRMLSGHLQGSFLEMISCMMRPSAVLEIGTYTGYSAICLAQGLTENGVLHTIDINYELEDRVRGYFEEANLSHKIHYHVGNALEIIPALDGYFDLVFIDADKINYHLYFEMVIDKVRAGGFIIADNVLWSGKVVENLKKIDEDTQAILDFNAKVAKDNRVVSVLVPIRDGLMVLRKK